MNNEILNKLSNMSDDEADNFCRTMLSCIGCGKQKESIGLVVCWDCFKYTTQRPQLKHYVGGVKQWALNHSYLLENKNPKPEYHPMAQYIDCKLLGADYCDKCGWTNENKNVAGKPDALKKLFDSLPEKDKRRE